VIAAKRGEYEPARQTLSDFYTNLRNEVDLKGSDSIYSAVQRRNLRTLLLTRDEVITLLARSDPAALNG
jgi:hypothetical protein